MDNYNRSIALYDEPHAPITIDAWLHSGGSRRAKFLSTAHDQSYLEQMKLLHSLEEEDILEIGPGEQFTARNLRTLGYRYDTVDALEEMEPTIVSSLEELDPNPYREKYGTVCAFQLLEHIPYGRFTACLRKMAAMSKRYVAISLPYSCRGYTRLYKEWNGQNNLTREQREDIYEPTQLPNRKYREEFMREFPWAVHYWELGRQGFSIERIIADIESCNLRILRRYHSLNPYHYFIVMEKDGVERSHG